MYRSFALLLLALLWSGCSSPRKASQNGFDFALIGDVPYNEFDATNSFPNMIAEINGAPMTFVVHNGDIKAGADPCSDEIFHRCYKQFQTFAHPLVYLFGDNEWSDCPRTNSHTPDERLLRLREIFCKGDQSLGQRTIQLERQSQNPAFAAYRENVRWRHGGIMFAGFNVPGSANNFGKPEFAERNKANLAWLRGSFQQAKTENAQGIMLIMQANPHFELARTNKLRAGFNEFLDALESQTVLFERPVVLVHGDSHYFRIDKPLLGRRSKRRIENFTRVETFGNPDVHWVRAHVDARNPNVFSFEQCIIKKNLGPPLAGRARCPSAPQIRSAGFSRRVGTVSPTSSRQRVRRIHHPSKSRCCATPRTAALTNPPIVSQNSAPATRIYETYCTSPSRVRGRIRRRFRNRQNENEQIRKG